MRRTRTAPDAIGDAAQGREPANGVDDPTTAMDADELVMSTGQPPRPIAPTTVSVETQPVQRLPPPEPVRRTRESRPTAIPVHPRTADARLARLHLRGGLLTLARAELEQMAGASSLDREALVDLAEARWRSGDLAGAAEAAEAHLAVGGEEPMAILIAAEQAEREGRILDARQRATLVQQRIGEGIERLFAGERRSTVWPVAAPGWMDTGAGAPGRWGLLVGGAEVADPDPGTWPTAPGTMSDALGIQHTSAAGRAALRTRASGLTGSTATTDMLQSAGRQSVEHLDAAEADLARGDIGSMVDRLALLLRLDASLAPVILSIAERAIEGVGDTPPDPARTANTASLQLLRGDIYRGLGRDQDAADAYQEALRALPGRAITMESS